MLHAVIMAGGAGTRFWPASRADRPKQLLTLAGDRPLLAATVERLEDLVPPERTWVVTTEATVPATRAVLPGIPADQFLGEPCGRDTAACVGWAADTLLAHDPDATCLVLPADHVIGDHESFRQALAAGAEWVERHGGLLTFGLRPTRPETGFGYLEVGAEAGRIHGLAVHQLQRFVEKPDAETAVRYLAGRSHLWNSGMFAWRATDLRREIERQLPELAAGLDAIRDAPERLAAIYPGLPRTSVDFGVMEGAATAWTVPVAFEWSDVGSWSAVREVWPADGAGNRVRGRVVTLDASGCVVSSDGPVVAVAGVDDLVVVVTGDAVLVVPAEDAQRVKELVAQIRQRGWDEVL